MARYVHRASGARVSVRDDKVMDSSWEAVAEKSEAPAKKAAPRKRSAKSE